MNRKSACLGICAFVSVMTLGCAKESSLPVRPDPSTAEIRLSSTAFEFNGKDPVATLTLTAVGADSIRWRIENRRYFIEVTPDSGIIRGALTVQVVVHRAGVPVGTQTGVFDVIQLPDSQKTQVQVTMEVLAPTPAEPWISEERIEFPYGVSEVPLIIGNAGEIGFDWKVDRTATSSWLRIEPDSGRLANETDTLRVFTDLDNYPAGVMSGNIAIETRVGLNPLQYFTLPTVATTGRIIAAFNLTDSGEVAAKWEGDWHFFHNAMVGEAGERLDLRPGMGPWIADYSKISIQGTAQGGITVYPDNPQGIHTEWMTIRIGEQTARQNIDKTATPWRFTAYTSPSQTPPDPGFLALDFQTYSDINYCDGAIWIWNVEVWEK